MKTRTAARLIGLISLLVLVLTLLYGSTWANGVIPTNQWVNFFSANTTFLGQPVPAGAYIAAYDPDGVQCGEFTVTTEGKYGYLLCYRDDATTPGVDEGAEPGDVINFTINGLPSVPLGPDDPIWTTNGDRREVNLRVPVPVGGVIVPVNKLELLVPWLGMAALVVLAALAVMLVRRRKT